MKGKEINELLAEGYILCRVVFEMAGNPKEHVEATFKHYINTIKEDPEYVFLKEDYAPCEETGEGIWGTFVEADILVKNFEKLNLLCFNLSPASVEIIQPSKFEFTDKNLTDWYNDLISKLHEVSMTVKSQGSENDLLKLNINRLIRNCVILALTESKTAEEIGAKIGIGAEHLQPFLDAMIKEEKIASKEGKYELKNKN